MNEVYLLWGFGLFGVAIVLFFIELFVPTGGIVGILTGVAAIAGVVSFFRASPTWGWLSLLIVILSTPAAIWLGLKVWPNTPIGRRLILGSIDDDPEAEGMPKPDPQDEIRQALVGATGVAVTDLRPVGVVRIEGERVEALAEGGLISAGQPVRITAVEGNRIKVRAAKA